MDKTWKLFLILLGIFLSFNLFLLFPATYMLWFGTHLIDDYSTAKYHSVDKIESLGTNRYRAGIKCLQESLEQLVFNCDIEQYQTLKACQKFPCQTEYTEIEFECKNVFFIEKLKSDTGGYQEKGDSKEFWGGLVLVSISTTIICSFLGILIVSLIILALELRRQYKMGKLQYFSKINNLP